MKLRQLIFALAAVTMMAALFACSGSPKKVTVPQAISVAFSSSTAPPSSLLTNAQMMLTAVVSNDSFNDGVTWSLSCGSTVAGDCGYFPTPRGQTGLFVIGATGSDIPETYTAPSQIPPGNSVTITATSVSDTTKSVQTTITITAPISVAFSTSTVIPSSLQINTQLAFTAVVSNDAQNEGVNWSVSCGSAGACGSFSVGNTASGTATTYTAPSQVPSDNTVTVTATSVADPTQSAQATITITTISVSFNPALPTSIPPSGQRSFTAVVSNDAANGGVTWTVTCGSPGACGTFSLGTTRSGSATTYTAPSVIPVGNAVTITATSATDPTKSVQANILITVPALADGNYVFSLSGTDQTAQPYFVAGVFNVTGGAITGGEQDFDDLRVMNNDQINGGGSSISGTADGNVQITLTMCSGTDCTGTDTSVGVHGVETLNGAQDSASRSLITEFDNSATSSGTLDLQTSTAIPSGGYAFLLHGIDRFALPLAIGGVLNVDNPGTISGSGSIFDISDASFNSNFALVLADQSFFPSTVSTPDSLGRVTFILIPATPDVRALSLAGYVIDATHIRLVESSDSFGAVSGGTALGQGTNVGTFSNASLSGSNFVISASGRDTNAVFNNGAFQVAGVLTANSGGTVNGTLNFNDLSGLGVQAPLPFTGTYTVDSTGRATLSNLTDSGATFNFNIELYLTGDGHATMISMDPTDVLAGLGFQQTGGGSFNAGSFGGVYIMAVTGADPSNENEINAVGPVTADGIGALSGTVDLNWIFETGPTADLGVSGKFISNPNGVFTGTITGVDVTANSNQDAFTYYVIDTTKVVAIETDSNQLTLGYFELKQ